MKTGNNRRSIVTQFISLLILLVLTGCTKDNPETQDDGDFYVRCLLNGEEWESCCLDPACRTWGNEKELKLDYYDSNRHLEFIFRNHCGNVDQVHGLHADGIVVGTINNIRRIEFSDANMPSGCSAFDKDSLSYNQFYVSEIDYNNKVMSGLFEYDLYNACKDTIKVRDGSFRVKFRFFP